jgi:hypothetical protein
MAKGVPVDEILKSMTAEQRAEFAREVKSQSGVVISLTVAGRGRKRKHRWAGVKGKVVAVRFSDQQYGILVERVAGLSEVEPEVRSPGDYLKWLAFRRHGKRSVSSDEQK